MADEKKEQPKAEAKKEEAKPEAKAEKPKGPAKAPETFRTLLGKKVGMTQVFNEEGELKPVTVIEAGPCSVLRVKTADGKDGYNAVLLGYGERKEKALTKADIGQFKKLGVKPARYQKEIRVNDAAGLESGQTVTLEGRFSVGDYVDVQGTSKGHGFAGVMKRHGFGGLPGSHGASDKERSPGSISARRSLGRILPGHRMGGHMGVDTVTSVKIEVVEVHPEENRLYVKGSVPGAKGSLVVLKETAKLLKKVKAKPKSTGPKKDKMGNIIKDSGKKGGKK